MANAGSFTSATPKTNDTVIGFAAGGGAGSDRRFPAKEFKRTFLYAFEPNDPANSLAHQTDLVVGDAFKVLYFSSLRRANGGGVTYFVLNTTSGTVGVLSNSGSSAGVVLQGTGFQFRTDDSDGYQLAAFGLTLNGTQTGQQSAHELIRAAAQARGVPIGGQGTFKATETTDLRYVATDFADLEYQFGNRVNASAGTRILSITKGNPAVITTGSGSASAHSFVAGQKLRIWLPGGMGEAHGKYITVSNPTSTTFEANLNTANFATHSGSTGALLKCIDGITLGNPTIIQSVNHGFANGAKVQFWGLKAGSTSELEYGIYTVANAATNSFELRDNAGGVVDSSGWRAFTSEGVIVPADHGAFYIPTKAGRNHRVTISSATSGLVTFVGPHGLNEGDPIVFGHHHRNARLPSGIIPLQTYYVRNPTTNSFNFSSSVGGSLINTAGSASRGTEIYCFVPPSAVTNIIRQDVMTWHGLVLPQGVGLRLCGAVDLSLGRRQTVKVSGDGFYDHTFIPTVVGARIESDNSPHSRPKIKAAYCGVGYMLWNNVEKIDILAQVTYCRYGCVSGYAGGSGSADTTRNRLIGSKCMFIMYSHPGLDTSIHTTLLFENNDDPADGSAISTFGSGKHDILDGKKRSGNGVLQEYIGKESNFGADTFTDNLIRIHVYGTTLYDKVMHLVGSPQWKDTDDGPDVSGSQPGPAVWLNQVRDASGFLPSFPQSNNVSGFWIGGSRGSDDPFAPTGTWVDADALYPREANLGRWSVVMGETLPFQNNGNIEQTDVAAAFPTTLQAGRIRKMKGGSIELHLLGNLQLDAGVEASNGVPPQISLDLSFKRYTLTNNATAAYVGYPALVDISTGKLPTALNDYTLEYSSTSPAAPSQGIILLTRKRVGNNRLAYRAPNNRTRSVQTLLGTNRTRLFVPAGNSLTSNSFGFNGVVSGTQTLRNVTNANDFTMMTRLGFVASSAAAGQAFGWRHSSLQFARANLAGGSNSGFEFITRFGMAVVDNNLGRLVVGFVDTSAELSGTSDPSSLTNCVFIGKDDGDANLSIFSNDASGTCTKTTLGAGFPANTANTDAYEVRIYCKPNGDRFFWSCENLSTAAIVEGSVTANIPTSTTLLTCHVFGSTGTSIVAMGLDLMSLYVESDG